MKALKIQPIKHGTVIDHIDPGCALKVLRILKIPEEKKESIVSAVMNVKGKRGRKDIVKIEDRELDPKEVDKIALLAPQATINIIRDYKVVEKHLVEVPDEITDIVKCANPNCISNAREYISSRFMIKSRAPIQIRCFYCGREPEDIASRII